MCQVVKIAAARETSEPLLPPPVNEPDPASPTTCVGRRAVSALFRSWPLPCSFAPSEQRPPCPATRATQVAARRARGWRRLCLPRICGFPARCLQLASWKRSTRLCVLSCKLGQEWPTQGTISFLATWDLAAYVRPWRAGTRGMIRQKPKARPNRRRCRRW